jgi:hypothetical protein
VASRSWKKRDPPTTAQPKGAVHKEDNSEAEKKMLMSNYSKLVAGAEDSKALNASKPHRIGMKKAYTLQTDPKPDGYVKKERYYRY